MWIAVVLLVIPIAGHPDRAADREPFGGLFGEAGVMSRDVISDEVWAVIGPLFPAVKVILQSMTCRSVVFER